MKLYVVEHMLNGRHRLVCVVQAYTPEHARKVAAARTDAPVHELVLSDVPNVAWTVIC